jgi:diguanylate cyclase (GGDEF)-like protein
MLDIDHFKNFNDTYGHEGGDEVLRELGALLETRIRGGDIACRYGGEEFLLILPEVSLEITQQRAEQIRQAVREMKIEFHRRLLGVITVSLGAAIFPDHGSDSAALISAADKALYKAKHKGRDRVEAAE